MDEPVMQGAIVEIVDTSDKRGKGPILPRSVFVNGTHVGYTQGVEVDLGSKDEPTRVTLTLLPRQVVIRGAGA